MMARVLALVVCIGTLPLLLGGAPRPLLSPAAAPAAIAPSAVPASEPSPVEGAAAVASSHGPPATAAIAVRVEPEPPAPALEATPAAGRPIVRRSWLSVPAVGLELPVICCYTDMTGTVIPAHGVATVDARAGANNFYLLGHNPGVFSPLMSVGPGSWVRYWDGQGLTHDFQVQARYQVSRTDVSPLVASYGSATLTLQTCLTGTTSTVWVWRAAAR